MAEKDENPKVEMKFDPDLKHEHLTGKRKGEMNWEEPKVRPISEWTEEQKIKWLKEFGAGRYQSIVNKEDSLCTVIRILQGYDEDYEKLVMFLRETFPKLLSKTKGQELSTITINVFDKIREIVDPFNLGCLVKLASRDFGGETEQEEALIQKYKTFLLELK